LLFTQVLACDNIVFTTRPINQYKYRYKYKFGLVERGLQIVQGRWQNVRQIGRRIKISNLQLQFKIEIISLFWLTDDNCSAEIHSYFTDQ